MIRFRFHPEASRDLENIWTFIAQESPDAADHVINRIYEAIESLTSFPYQGHKRTDLTSRPLRFITVADYLIAYAPDENPLWVVAILHGKRSPQILAATLGGRET